jgi:hypothetical protein
MTAASIVAISLIDPAKVDWDAVVAAADSAVAARPRQQVDDDLPGTSAHLRDGFRGKPFDVDRVDSAHAAFAEEADEVGALAMHAGEFAHDDVQHHPDTEHLAGKFSPRVVIDWFRHRILHQAKEHCRALLRRLSSGTGRRG